MLRHTRHPPIECLWWKNLIFARKQQNPLVTISTTSLTFTNSTFCPHSAFMRFVWIWEKTAIFSLYSINWLVFITETEYVYCAVRTGSLIILITPSMLHSHGSSGQSPTSHCVDPDSVPINSMCNVWWTNCNGTCFSPSSSVFPCHSSITPQILRAFLPSTYCSYQNYK
jgi:hypothetical protein